MPRLERNICNKQKAITYVNSLYSATSRTESHLPQLVIPQNISSIFRNVLTDFEAALIKKGFTFLVTYPHSNLDLDMACTVESVVSKFPHTLVTEFRRKIRSMFEKSKYSRPDMSNKEFKTVISLKLKKDIKFILADKGNCTGVLAESK
jgi:hypothetical protein